jgi:hypothetical protein
MLEPDPDHRPKSLAVALDGMNTSIPPPAPRPDEALQRMQPVAMRREEAWAPVADQASAKEDAMVKSARSLLWMLWGIGWIIVPVVLAELHVARGIPIVMFGWLAALMVMTWHKGVFLRVALRKLGMTSEARRLEGNEQGRRVLSSPPPAQDRVRVAVDTRDVTVRGAELPAEDGFSATEVSSANPDAQARRERVR